MLLQILDDGRLTDSHGRVVSFENAVIIMTSNAGTSSKAASIGFGNDAQMVAAGKINSVLKDIFRPEFLNRVDEVVVFNELSRDELLNIVRLMINEVSEEVAGKGMKLKVSSSAIELLAKEGYDPRYGARPMRRLIQKKVEDAIAEQYLKGMFKQGDAIYVDTEDGSIKVSNSEEFTINE